jgi:hypothetical protein
MVSLTVSYPSATAPAFPAFEITLPDGWITESVPYALVAAQDPAAPRGFRTNLVVVVQRHPVGLTLDGLDTTVQSTLGARIERDSRAAVDGADARRITATYQAAEGPPLYQDQLYVVVPADGTGVVDLLQFDLSCAAEHAERYQTDFDRALASVKIARP